MDDDGLFVVLGYLLAHRPDKVQHHLCAEIGVEVFPVLDKELVHQAMVTALDNRSIEKSAAALCITL